jgi:photosystem II stability/assembly factor-like uncharacterized protein
MKSVIAIFKVTSFVFLTFLISPNIFAQGWFISHTFSPAQTVYAIKFYDANTGYCVSVIYGGSTLNIYKTTNAGGNWTAQSSGYTGTRFMCIWIQNPDTVYMSGNNGLIIKTTNGGVNWVTLPTGVTNQLWGICFVNSFTGYVCGDMGKIMKTTDAGASWSNLTSGLQNALSSIYFRNEITGYISGSAIIMKTTNAGTSWTPLNAPYVNFENIREITFTDDNTGYGVSDQGRILHTTNAGTSWDLLNSGTTEALFSINFTSPDTAFVCGYNGTIIRTTDAGVSWSPQVSGVTDILTKIWFTSPAVGYISTWYSKILKTTNGGITFVQKLSNEVPGEFSLRQNYPNPFNPSTTIKFDIPAAGQRHAFANLRLTVYDITGKEIAVLLNEPLAEGSFEVVWNSPGYASGVYFYKLTAGSFTETRKMVLSK